MNIEEALAYDHSWPPAGEETAVVALSVLAAEIRRLRAKEYSPMAEPGSDHLHDRKYVNGSRTWWRREGNRWVETGPPLGWIDGGGIPVT